MHLQRLVLWESLQPVRLGSPNPRLVSPFKELLQLWEECGLSREKVKPLITSLLLKNVKTCSSNFLQRSFAQRRHYAS